MTEDKSREDRVRDRAYGIWESEGRLDGQHDDHWHRAAAEIDSDASGGAEGSTDEASAEASTPESPEEPENGAARQTDPAYGPA